MAFPRNSPSNTLSCPWRALLPPAFCTPSALPRIRGFTLLELLVVMAIIGLLASYVGPKYFSQLGQSEHKVAQAQVAALSNALDTFRLDVGRYPSTAEGLNALYVRPASAARWNGPYLRKPVPPDPWGKAYVYRNPGSKGREVDVISLGSDGRPGGSDLAADITN
jgi:general secretion pathway protein G